MRTRLQLLAFPLAALALAALAQPLMPPERRLTWRRDTPSPLPAAQPQAPAPPAPTSPPAAAPTSQAPKPEPGPRPGPTRPPSQAGPTPEAVPYPAEADREALLARFPPLSEGSWAEVDGEAALWLHAHGAVFLDARRSTQFREGHVKGARSLPAWESGLNERIQLLALLAPDPRLPFVIYCSGGDCQDSHVVAEALRPLGFVNLRIYREGYPDWVARGGAQGGTQGGDRSGH